MDSDESDDEFSQQEIAHQQEIECLKAKIAELEEKSRDRDRWEQKCKGLEIRLEALDDMKEHLAQERARYAKAKREKEAANKRNEELQNSIKDLQCDLSRLRQDRDSLNEKMKHIAKEYEWEKVFREGLTKGKVKLEATIKQLEHELAQQKQFTGVAQTKFQAEQKEVKRELAQRLLDLQKLNTAQTERNEMEKLAQEKVKVAEEAVKREATMQAMVEPLRIALREASQQGAEDNKIITEQAMEIATLREEQETLKKALETSEEEVRLTKRKLGKEIRDLKALQAVVFRMIKEDPSLASNLTEDLQKGILSQINLATSVMKRSSVLLPFLNHGPNQGENDQDYEKKTNHNFAWKFALYVEECAEQLESVSAESKVLHQQQRQQGLGSTPNVSMYRGRKKRPKNSRNKGDGSLYIGHGLGIKKK